MITFDVKAGDPIKIPERFRDELETYRHQAKYLRVMISPLFPPRSRNQNAIFHAKVNSIAHMTGMDREDVKKAVKEIALSMGYPAQIGEDGRPMEEDGHLVPLPSSSATVEQMNILIRAIDEFCFRYDIDLEEVWHE